MVYINFQIIIPEILTTREFYEKCYIYKSWHCHLWNINILKKYKVNLWKLYAGLNKKDIINNIYIESFNK